MTTLEKIEFMDEQSYAEISSLLSRGNVTLQGGGIFTEKDFDAQSVCCFLCTLGSKTSEKV